MTAIPSAPAPAPPPRRGLLRLAVAVLVLLGLVLGQVAAGRDEVSAAVGPTVGPTTSPTTSPTTVETTRPPPARGAPGIIPEPNSGVAPDDPSDRGGWQQWAVLAAILGGLGVIAGLVVRESRRARHRRGAL